MSPSAAASVSVVLVHGGFVDGSGWQGVYNILQQNGYRVGIVQNPTISLDDDVAVTRRVVAAQPGPVVLVGHSYGGVVIQSSSEITPRSRSSYTRSSLDRRNICCCCSPNIDVRTNFSLSASLSRAPWPACRRVHAECRFASESLQTVEPVPPRGRTYSRTDRFFTADRPPSGIAAFYGRVIRYESRRCRP